MSDDELQAFSTAINTALAPFLKLEPAPERRLRTFATALIPTPPSKLS
ncbi:MAG: hypothetical protein AAFS10_00625 [Myxococcota bacterium]